MATDWKKIQSDWENSKITLPKLAEKHGVKLGTLKSRKSREKWSRDPTEKDATKNQKVATSSKRMQLNKGDSLNKKPQQNRSGNPNPTPKFPKRNSAATKHGFYSKHIPAETLEIMDGLFENPADLIWEQIQIQGAAIIRAQRIMFVRDADDHTEWLKKEKKNDFGTEKEYDVQFAWDKHATFMNAQSRAMSELRSLIKQFWDMSYEDDERRLKIEQMTAGIEKTNAEIDKLTGKTDDGPIEILIKRKGEGE